jgi:hypothetical protein
VVPWLVLWSVVVRMKYGKCSMWTL